MGKLITADDLLSGIDGMTEKEVLAKFEEFLKWIETAELDDEGKVAKTRYHIVPTISAFADYINQPRAEIHRWFREHPTASGQMREMCADTIAAGAMLKAYDARVTSFALKNWCGWKETPADKGKTGKEVADEKKAEEKLDAYWAAKRRSTIKAV